MGRRRLIVQADLTSEEDQAFLTWVKAKLRRRRLAEEIRAGLRLQYEQATGQAAAAYPSYRQSGERPTSLPHVKDVTEEGVVVTTRLQKLVHNL